MNEKNIEIIYSEEREKNIALFKPLFKLDSSTKEEYSDLPLRQLGVAVLIYILEHMYKNEKDCTMDKIATFLRYLLYDQMERELTEEEAYVLTQHIVSKNLMNEGKPHKHLYWDFSKKENAEFTFNLIEIEDLDRNGKTYLRLSNECLDMLFKTKELYGELKLSVRALFFKQQMSKNVFDGALQELKEMKGDVENEKVEIERLKREIRRNVLDKSKKEKIKDRLNSVNKKLENERSVFAEMTGLVKELLKDLDGGELGNEENHAFILVKKIQKSLVEVVSAHDELFGKKLDLQKFSSEAIQTLINQSFSVRVNFKDEILKRVIEEGTPTDVVWKMIAPLFGWKLNKSFHPGIVFEPQRITRRKDTSEVEVQVGVFDEEYDEYVRKIEEQKLNMKINRIENYFRFILSPLKTKEEVTLSELLASNGNEVLREDILSRGNFYHFLVEIHQYGEIDLFKQEEADVAILSPISRAMVNVCEEDGGIYQIQKFSIMKHDEKNPIYLLNGYVMSDFTIRRLEDGTV